MAYTRIHAIKSTIAKAVAYICNPDKTEERLLIDTFGCGIETAGHDFEYALSRTKQSDKNLAFHLIQSFAQGEVSYEEAHRIGIELADKLLQNRFKYIVATHVDKGHPHNHIIFCAADNIDHKKYYDNKRSYRRIRQLSDELCTEHGLSVIPQKGRKGKKYIEWKAEQEGTSWKKQLKDDIDECVKIAKSYEEFLRLIREKGYKVTGEEIGDPGAKYIKFTAPGQKRPIRGSCRNFGSGYTKEEIKDRIEHPEKWQIKEQTVLELNTSEASRQKSRIKIPKKDILTRTGASRTLIDTTGDKFQNSPGLQHWASIKNLKTAAASYAAADNLSALQKQITTKSTEAKSTRSELVGLEHKMKKVAELLLYAEQYHDNKPFQIKYEKSKDPDRYMRMHETHLILFDGAERMLLKIGVDPKSVDPAEIRADYEAMQARKENLEKKWKSAEKEARDLQQKLTNVEQYIGRDTVPEQQNTNDQDISGRRSRS
ncbi:MAG: relaxase/mobilization nuclease domain-containing protein [Lachnospiraceae bacterium]|nr:relaxase/mobilization nuclease domain-containing protein [Lachnospiraceae bacterium]